MRRGPSLSVFGKGHAPVVNGPTALPLAPAPGGNGPRLRLRAVYETRIENGKEKKMRRSSPAGSVGRPNLV